MIKVFKQAGGRGLASAVAAFAVAFTGLTGSAPATERVAAPDPVQTFKNRATGACLDDSRFGLRVMPCGGGNNHQRWIVTDVGGAFRILKNVATGACLDDSEHNLRAHPCNDQVFQKWERKSWNGGTELKSQATGKCLDDSHLGLRTYGCTGGGPNQLWY